MSTLYDVMYSRTQSDIGHLPRILPKCPSTATFVHILCPDAEHCGCLKPRLTDHSAYGGSLVLLCHTTVMFGGLEWNLPCQLNSNTSTNCAFVSVLQLQPS